MSFIKRFGLFLLLNFLIIVSISTILNVLQIKPFLQASGINYTSLFTFCLIWGMTGSIISLLLSKTIAKYLVGIQRLSETHPITQKVYRLAQLAGLKVMPEVGIFESHRINAFATGPTRNHSLIAVSSALLEKLNDKEIEGVLGHEIAHIVNGDMVTMSLLQGLINTFVMFLARVFAFFVASVSSSRDQKRFSPFIFSLCTMLFEIIFMLLGYLALAFFSRKREYRADEGGASLAGTDNMIAALQKLQTTLAIKENPKKLDAVKFLQINGKTSSFSALFATHPSLEKRIEKLKQSQVQAKGWIV